jgi:hypothetical protein
MIESEAELRREGRAINRAIDNYQPLTGDKSERKQSTLDQVKLRKNITPSVCAAAQGTGTATNADTSPEKNQISYSIEKLGDPGARREVLPGSHFPSSEQVTA